MTDKLPPHILKLFAPRPPLPYLPPTDPDRQAPKPTVFSGVAAVLERCKDHDVDYTPSETPQERKERLVLSFHHLYILFII